MKRIAALAATLTLTGSTLAITSATQAVPVRTGPTGLSQATPTAKQAYQPPPLSWSKCSGKAGERGLECATVVAPMNYAKPDGPKVKLAISRLKATDTEDRRGVMLVNPGGPGGSGLTLAVLGNYVPDGVGGKYDWIGFDPRGVGASTPTLRCDSRYFDPVRPQYVPNKPGIKQKWLRKARGYARDCGKSPARRILPHLRSKNTVRDMETIRKALGEQKINFYGFSYGTYLATRYMTDHPQRVGKFVLDGVVNADRAWYPANLDQDRQFDRNIKVFFRWVAKYPKVYGLGTDPAKIRQRYYAKLRQLSKKPVDRVGPAELTDAMLGAGYYVFGWEDSAKALSALLNKNDGKPMFAQYEGNMGDDNGYAIYNGVQCTDARWPGLRKTMADSRRIHRNFPFMTWSNTWYNAPCLTWPAPSTKRAWVTGKKVQQKILMIAETKDAATPYAGALAMRKRFPSASLIEGVGGTTHSGSLNGVTCVDDAIARYLDTGEVPARKAGNVSDKQCPAVPKPTPAAGALTRNGGMPVAVREDLLAAQRVGLR